ncbi:MAG: Phage integrase family [Acidobacteriaceae bacterium]|nr:Phage integrase family [Acidobacteriaceae bacterium]
MRSASRDSSVGANIASSTTTRKSLRIPKPNSQYCIRMRAPTIGFYSTSLPVQWHVTTKHTTANTATSRGLPSPSGESSTRHAQSKSASGWRDNINERRKSSKSALLFPQKSDPTKPDKHLLRKLQKIGKRAKATFHTELHKLRKTGASRRYLSGVSLPTLMQELGHESLATTQAYLDDVRKEEELKKAVADSDYVPKPRLVSGTDGH